MSAIFRPLHHCFPSRVGLFSSAAFRLPPDSRCQAEKPFPPCPHTQKRWSHVQDSSSSFVIRLRPTMRFGIRAAAALIATVGTNSFASSFTTGSSRVRPPTSHLAMSTLPSWSDLQSSASSTPVGAALDNEVALRPTGRAAPFVQNKLRLFDSEDFSAEKPPNITLYRDHAGWCPYCQSECGVRLVSSILPHIYSI